MTDNELTHQIIGAAEVLNFSAGNSGPGLVFLCALCVLCGKFRSS